MSQQDDVAALSQTLYGVFDDPALIALIEEALVHNADLRASAHRLRANALLLTPTLTASRPQLGLQGQADQILTGGRHDRSEQASLSVSWTLDVWGRLAAEAASAEAEHWAQSIDLDAARLSLAALVAQRWVALNAAERDTTLLHERMASLEELRLLVRGSYRAGLTGLDDEAAIRTQIELARSDLAAAEDIVLSTRRELEVLLGRMPTARLDTPQSAPRLHPPLTAAPALVLAQRPDIQAAFLRLEAADQSTRAAYRALLPDLTLTGSAARSLGERALVSNLTQWSLVGGLQQTVFDHGALRDAARARIALGEAAVETYRQTVLTALSEVENALSQEQALARQQTALAQALAASRLSEGHARDRYRRGLVTAREMLQARLDHADIERAQARTDAARLDARIQLGLALGLPWTAQ